MSETADIALIGLAVMGQNLILNMDSKGFVVCAYNRTVDKVTSFLNNEAKGTKIIGAKSLQDMITKLKKPRKVMLLVKDCSRRIIKLAMKREREEDGNDNMLSSIKIFQNSLSQAVSAEDQSFGMVITDMLNTLDVRQKAEAKVHIIKYLTDMQLVAQHNKY